MNPEEQEEALAKMQMQGAVAQSQQQAQATQYYVQEQEKLFAEAQLECETTLKTIYYRLRQDILKPDKDGNLGWIPIEDQTKRRLTDDGVERIMELMSFYINKENLLSNFSEEQINRIMLTFRLAFTGNILMRYKIYFRRPSFEECKAILEKRVEERAKMRAFASELLGKEVSEKTIKEEMLEEMEERIEYEIEKIREEKSKENLKEFEMLFEELSQMILATLNRAWKGEERGSLRRHTNITEISTTKPPVVEGRGGIFNWRRR